MKTTLVALMLALMSGCTSGLFANQATEQVDKAKVLQLQVELRNAAQAEETYFATNGSYAPDATTLNLHPDPEVSIAVTPSATDYCIQATHTSLPGVYWHITKTNPQPVEGEC